MSKDRKKETFMSEEKKEIEEKKDDQAEPEKISTSRDPNPGTIAEN